MKIRSSITGIFTHSKFSRILFFAVFSLLVVPLVHTSVAAELSLETQAKLEQIAADISGTVMSPFCPGRTLSACPSPQARDLREEIHSWLIAGMSPNEVMAKLESIYGEDVRGAPLAEGVGVFAWLMPVVFISSLFFFLVALLRRLRKKDFTSRANAIDSSSVSKNSQDTRASQKYSDQVEREIKRRLA